ncbi:Thioredoxin-like superfamily [Sesbania bispinosa]|nr:Thioredoxin-like superfamily [Sesbania bispinosa]
MGLASVVHNGVQIPFNFDHSPLRVSHSPPISKFSAFHSVHHPISAFCSVYPHRVPLLCSRRISQNNGLPSSEAKRISAQPKDDISNVERSRTQESQGNETYNSSVRTVALWVCTAVAFGVGLGFIEGFGKASEFFAGYILEQSLSVDNLFVFVLIFKYFKVPFSYQNRVLSYGIAGAVVFRLTLILLGTATLQRFEEVNLLFAAILLFSSFKLFASEEDESDLSDNFVVKTCQKLIPVTTYYDGNRFITNQDGVWKATPLLLTVAVIELSDIAFAVDSIPAVFGVTRDPFVVFTSNLFAILGLRSLYMIISEGMSELKYLQPSIAVVLGFIGCKMVLDYFGGFCVVKILYALKMEVRPPPLTSTSDPPPLFDGTTRLFINYACPYAQRVWITRNYKGLQDKIQLVPIDLQNRPAWYKEKLYPENKHNGKVLGESLDLIKYVDANIEGTPLLPSDPAKKEFGEQLLSHVDTFTRDLFVSLKGDAVQQASPAFEYLENALGKFDDGPFLLGQFSLVDIAYIPFVERFHIVFAEVFKHDITEGRPKLKAWIEELNKIGAYTETRVDPQEIVDLFKKRFLPQQ